MSFFIWGDHTAAAYSRCGRIMVVKRFRKLSLFRSVNDLLMAPIIRLALLTCSVMCMLKLSLSSNMTPRSFSWLTILSGRVGQKLGGNTKNVIFKCKLSIYSVYIHSNIHS